MKTSSKGAAPGRQALIEAADWFVEFRVGDADVAARQEFDRWVRRSPENNQAYLQIATTWSDLSQAKPEAPLDVQQLVAGARDVRNVVEMGPAPISHSPPPAKSRPRVAAIALLAATIACLCVGTALVLRSRAPIYATGIGEQRFLTLPDGSTVELNARSSVQVRFSGRERLVELVEGQALFDIAKDAGRPFTVKSGETRIRALGTQFDVYRKASGTTVTVLEGRVAVTAGAATSREPAPETTGRPEPLRSASVRSVAGSTAVPLDARTGHGLVYLSAGERLVVSPSRALSPVTTNVEAARAWTQRRLIFDSSRLADVVEEFNRYNHRPLLIESESLHDMLISGVYSSTDPASLLRFLRHQPGVQVSEAADGIRISTP